MAPATDSGSDSGPVYANALEMIGRTPLVRVANLETGPCELFLKLESQNPGGSIKDRIGKSMIEAAERDGRLKPGGTIVEATAGNTGLGLALVAAQKGYRLIIVVPDKMAQEKIFHLKALGAEVRLTRSDVGKGHPEYYQDMAERIAAEEGAFYANQFGNPANPEAHEKTTGPEIWEQMGRRLDALVCGVGSAGTITGLAHFFQKAAPEVEMVLADPEGSVLAELIETGKPADHVGSWVVEGIGEDFVPPVADFSHVHKAYTIPDREALLTARELLRKEGILAGSSSGTLLAAALRYCREQTGPKRVVTFVCDSGNKYLSKMYNDYWMIDQGFIERPQRGDLRDLIGRKHDERATVTTAPDDTLLAAYGRMKLYDVSQLPVMDKAGTVVGLLDESDLLLHVVEDERRFHDPVSTAMVERLETVEPDAAIRDLLPIFARDHVAIVMEHGRFQGLITRIDLLNHLRRKLK
ncbi:cystathionine beta-synthase [Tistlia consotensis]|uniref:Cysteine synthase B n=1 Tax=Tistlia consotensis USBA 355 TaxID=560819 RepID=A0A1Y6BPA4_9PROT|nr:cystathionine beta-synthase [Tistlia consotensis]SMF18055.1 cystathionine beta-synthase [Tistlia consotensis USBA 355]SNR39992.1 cystathionine beta-synthase [Tistlia consotensis]